MIDSHKEHEAWDTALTLSMTQGKLSTGANNQSEDKTLYYVYMLTNKYNKVLYTGVTNNLKRRLFEHRDNTSGFTAKYNTDKLVYYEASSDVKAAIAREKQIKGWKREKKDALINSINPAWRDLSDDWKE